MEHLNMRFLEEYKRLDKLCKEIYRADRGISSYIDDMKASNRSGNYTIPGWSSDLDQLIRLRHLRNKLTHEVGTTDLPICTENDIQWVADFHSRILSRTDPIAKLYTVTHKPAETTHSHNINKESNNSEVYYPFFAALPILFIILILLFILCK